MTRDQKGFYFSTPKRPDLLWVLPSILFNGYRGSSPGVERPGREADRSSPFRAEFNNECDYTSTFITCLPCVEGGGFTFTFICGWEAKQEVQMRMEPLADSLRTAHDRRFGASCKIITTWSCTNLWHKYCLYTVLFFQISLTLGAFQCFMYVTTYRVRVFSLQQALLLVTSSRRNLGPRSSFLSGKTFEVWRWRLASIFKNKWNVYLHFLSDMVFTYRNICLESLVVLQALNIPLQVNLHG